LPVLQWPPDLEEGFGSGGGPAVVAGWPAEGEGRPGGAGPPVGGAGDGGKKKAARRRLDGVMASGGGGGAVGAGEAGEWGAGRTAVTATELQGVAEDGE